MAKFTVYFKNNVIRSYLFEAERVRVGRDEANDLVIDSLEVAPVHALIVTRGDRCMIRQLNDDFPLIINGKSVKEDKLQHGDIITAGHYDLVYNAGNAVQSTKTNASYIAHTANFQVISGIGIGKIFHLNMRMTMIGEHGSGIVVISKRKEGYFASTLESTGIITLNNQPLDDKIIKLEHHDVLVVNNMTVQFYLH
ncbi:MAG: FHA domain-containing protein [Methylococcales bacterium]|nr:FHA domain-containing protein [Methylococcales bacterium]MDP3838933.1 FHA domain-containing protein [Methylococcales bacterium]